MLDQAGIVGGEIIGSEANGAGSVKKLVWWKAGTLAFLVERGREQEAYQWFERVEKIGDLAFVKALISLASAAEID